MPTAIAAIVSQIMTDYDHNGNGVIELTQAPAAGCNALSRFAHTLMQPDERISKDCEPGIPAIMPSYIRLFRAADVNHDQRVTPEEMAAVIARFDTNTNGQLESRGIAFWKACDEKQRFEKAFGEDQTDPDTYTP